MKKIKNFGIGFISLFSFIGVYASYERIMTDPVTLYQRQLNILERGANDTKDDIEGAQSKLDVLDVRLAKYQADWKDTRCLMAREEVEQNLEVNNETRDLCGFTIVR